MLKLLDSEGYQVISAADGTEALETFHREQNQIDLLLVDLNMPIKNGWVILNQMMEVNPSLPVFILTGLSHQIELAEAGAENRLTAINQGANQSEFSYDGLDRRVEIVEMTNSVAMTTNYYLWCDDDICELRDATGSNALRRLYLQGESLVGSSGTTNYYYTWDHLGSVREACD